MQILIMIMQCKIMFYVRSCEIVGVAGSWGRGWSRRCGMLPLRPLVLKLTIWVSKYGYLITHTGRLISQALVGAWEAQKQMGSFQIRVPEFLLHTVWQTQ